MVQGLLCLDARTCWPCTSSWASLRMRATQLVPSTPGFLARLIITRGDLFSFAGELSPGAGFSFDMCPECEEASEAGEGGIIPV